MSYYWENDNVVWHKTVTGMCLSTLDLKLAVGENPKISFEMSIHMFLETFNKEELEKLKTMVEERLEK